MDALSEKEPLNLSGLPREDFDKLEKLSREILITVMDKRDLAAHGIRLCDITVNYQNLSIAAAKRVMSYVQAVEHYEFSAKVADDHTEVFLRQALDLPNDEKTVLGIIMNLGVGLYRARQLVTILQSFQGAGFAAPTVQLRSIVSEGYGKYSSYEDRAARRAPPEGTQKRTRRPEEEPEEELEPVEPRPRRYSRDLEAIRDRGREPPRDRQKPQLEKGAPPEEIPSDLVGRRCLFHGGIAVARCGKCKAVLCKECIRGSERCPRCNTPLGAPGESAERRRASRDRRGEEREEEPEEIEEERPRKKGREQDRLQKKRRDEEEDLSRL